MKAKKIGALLLAGVMAASMVSATSVSAADAKRVCFVARASADTFAAWLTTEMKKQAENYDDIDLTCVSGEGDDNKENGLLRIVSQNSMTLLLFSQIIMVHRLRMYSSLWMLVFRLLQQIRQHIRMTWMVEMTHQLWLEQVQLMQIRLNRQKSVQREL